MNKLLWPCLYVPTHQNLKLKWFPSHLAVVFVQYIEAKCWVENEDVVGAVLTDNASTTSEWSTTSLPEIRDFTAPLIMVPSVLIWIHIYISRFPRVTSNEISWPFPGAFSIFTDLLQHENIIFWPSPETTQVTQMQNIYIYCSDHLVKKISMIRHFMCCIN